MKKYLVLGAFALALCACGEKPTNTYELECGDMDVYVTVYKDRLDAVIGEHKSRFAQTVTASGARYDGIVGDKAMALWSKGEEWIMIVGDAEAIACVKKEFYKD